MFDMTQTGKRISELCKKKDMTQLELADKLSISFQAVSNWETGKSMPDISKLPELAEILGVTIDDILGSNNAVLHDVVFMRTPNVEAYAEKDISEAAVLLKPSQIEAVLRSVDYAPPVLYAFLPYLSDATIEAIAEEHIQNGKNIAVLLPSLGHEKIEELVSSAKEKGEPIDYYIPFLRESTVKSLAFEAYEHGGISAASDYLPFMNEADILEFTRLISQSND